MKVKGKNVQCLVDTGSVKSVISNSLIPKLGLKIEESTDEDPLLTADGTHLKILGYTDINFYTHGLLIPHSFTVVQDLHPNLIIGTDFLQANHASVNFVTNTVSFYENMITLPLQGYISSNNCAILTETVCIPSMSECILAVKLPSHFRGTEVILEPIDSTQQFIAVAGSISDVCDNKTAKLRVLNFKPYSVTLKKNFKIAKIMYPATISTISKVKIPDDKIFQTKEEDSNLLTPKILEQFAKEYKLDLNPQLSQNDKNILLNTLYQYKDVLARSYKDLKIHNNYELDIELKDPRSKSYTRQYRLPEEDAEEADRQILELKNMGVVTENDDCSFNSPCFLIKKKTGNEKRFVCDLRKINLLIKPIIVSLPRIEDLLREATSLQGHIYSSGDMYKGYYQLRIRKNSHVTGFSSPKTGIHYKYNSAPMGLNISAAGFIQAMYRVFQDRQKFKFLLLYVDDCLVISKTIPEHSHHLKILCETLRANNLVLNAAKTKIGYSEIEFLGHTLSNQGIKISENKIKAIKNLQPPKTHKSLLRLLGLLNFFKKRIDNYSQKTMHMRRLLKKDTKFQWTEECTAELNLIKSLLIQNPILQPLQTDRETYIYTDASLVGLSGVILQFNDEGLPHVCAYFSQSTTESQKHWTPAQLEMSAVGVVLRAYESLLINQPITVFTDSTIVLNLQKYRPVNAREKRLILFLTQFNIKFKYIPGHRNKLSDCLSRIQEDMKTEQIEMLKPTEKENCDDFILAVSKDTARSNNETKITTQQQPFDQHEKTDTSWIEYRLHFGPLEKHCERTVNALVTGQEEKTHDMNVMSDKNAIENNSTYGKKHVLNANAPEFTPSSTTDNDQQTFDGSTSDTLRRSARIEARKQKQYMTKKPSATDSGPDSGPTTDAAHANKNRPTTEITDHKNIAQQIGLEPAHEQVNKSTSELLQQWAEENQTLTENNDDDDIVQTPDISSNDCDNFKIEESDYTSDTEFQGIYNYLKFGTLTGNEEEDRKILLLAENYFLQDDLLYKLSLPRKKKEQRVRDTYQQLCLPQAFRTDLITQYHNMLAHCAINKLHLMLIQKYYWRDLMKDICQVVKNCHVCLSSKINCRATTSPLRPLPVPSRPGEMIAIDHKVLSRRTDEGNAYVFVIIDHFSNYTLYIPVKSETAYDSAQAFVRHYICYFSIPKILISDKAQSFMSVFFNTIAQLLNIRLRSSAGQAKRSNGKCEMAIKKLNQGLKLYSTDLIDDRKIEQILPIIQLSVAASPQPSTGLSPFEILFGYSISLPIPIEMEIPNFASSDAENYAKHLKTSITKLHEAVRRNAVDTKVAMKRQYDDYHNVKEPDIKEGDEVYLKDVRIKPHSNRILTHRPFSGPYIVKTVVRHDRSIGPAYKIVHAKTGKEVRRLVGIDRLKKTNTMRNESKPHNVETTKQPTNTASIKREETCSVVSRPNFFKGVCILKHRLIDSKQQYLVLKTNNTVQWCYHVGPALLEDYKSRRRY